MRSFYGNVRCGVLLFEYIFLGIVILMEFVVVIFMIMMWKFEKMLFKVEVKDFLKRWCVRERELMVFSEGNDNVGVYCLC